MYQKLLLNCLWGPCVQNRVLVQRNMPLLCETLYRVHADVPPLFCWSLAPHPLPSACHRDSREWIHSKGSQRSLLLNWTRHELGPAAGFMHQKHKQFLLAALALCFTKIAMINQHPRVSVHPSDSCLCAVSVAKDFVKQGLRTKCCKMFCHSTRWMSGGVGGGGEMKFWMESLNELIMSQRRNL